MTRSNSVSKWTKFFIGWDFALGGWDLRYAVELYANGQPVWAAVMAFLAVVLFVCGIALIQVADW